MKESGIEWLGQIPNNWGIRPLKFILQVRNQKNNPVISEEILSLSIDKGVTLYAEKTTNKDRFKEDLTQYKLAYPNDIVMNSMNVIVGAVGISKYFGCVSPVYYVLFSSDQKKYLVSYYDFLFKTSTIKKVFFSLGRGIMSIEKGNDRVNTCRLKVSMSDLGRMDFPVPPYIKQKQIVDFLEEKCADIDNLVSLQQKMIEELKTYKQSITSECVCKGLDKSTTMKHSGIEWIGEIPNHWERSIIKHLGTARNGLTYSPNDTTDEKGLLVLRSSNIKDGNVILEDNVYVNCEVKDDLIVKENDILICSRNGSKKLIGKNAIIPNTIRASFGAFMMIFRCNMNAKYMYYILNSEVFKYNLSTFLTATINQLTLNNFNNMEIVITKIEEEQEKIVAFLDRKCSEIENLISIKQQKIEELNEYKKSMIYEYITGKKEVQS